MNDLVGEYLRRVEPIEGRRLDRGQLCWAPVSYLSSEFHSLTLESYDSDERLNRYSISTDVPDAPFVFNHAPVSEIGLQYNEAMLVNKTKPRPAIVISQPNSDWSMGSDRLAERGFVCIPIYSYQPRDSRDFRMRVAAQEYPWWIHIPNFSTFKEGFARLDRLQVIEQRQLRQMQYALTEDALWFVSEWLRYYLTEEIDPLLMDYREESARNLQ